MTVGTSTPWRTIFAVLVLLSAAVFWGGNPTATKILYRPDGAHFDPVGLFVARGAWSLPFFAAMVLVSRPDPRPTAREWWLLVATGSAFVVSTIALALAVQRTSVAHVTMLNSLTPPLTAVLGAAALHERVDLRRAAALAIGVAGALLLAFTRSTSGSSLAGDGFVIVQVGAIAAMFISGRAIGARFPATFTSGVYGSFTSLSLIAIGALAGRLPGAVLQPLAGDAATLWWFFGVIVVGITVYAQYGQAFALRTLGAGTTSLLGAYGTLAVSMVLAIALLHERINATGYVAGGLISIAVALALLPARRRRARVHSSPSQ